MSNFNLINPEIETPSPKAKGFLPKRENVQLACPANDLRLQKIGEFVFAQPKLNGERCRIEWISGKPHLISSYGNEFQFIEHIQEALLSTPIHKNVPYDGEIYIHGWPRERIDSALRRTKNRNPEVEKLQFHIFDIQRYDHKQTIRYQELQYHKKYFTNPLYLVPTDIIRSQDWTKAVAEYVSQDYEGAIFRNPEALYTSKRSTKIMLKSKPTKKDVYLILGIEEAISQEGVPKAMIGSFLVIGGDNSPFKVGAGKLSHKERKALWQSRKILIGKKLLVKHEELKTINNIPIAAVAVEVIV